MDKAFEDVQAEEALKRIKTQKDLQLIDVREIDEFEFGHISEAKNFPLSTFSEQLPKQLSADKPILCYCKAGIRSAYAAEILKQLGFKQVGSISGGLYSVNILLEKKIRVLEHYSTHQHY
ncbi:MAG: rhodanese-like domain-containing protein [archaeon]|nr:rhodanese-like domain-containing protein [archaeon]